MRKPKDIHINHGYKVRFELNDWYCEGTLMKRIPIFWGLFRVFVSTNITKYYQFTFNMSEHGKYGTNVIHGRIQFGIRYTYYHVTKFNFKSEALNLYDKWFESEIAEMIKTNEQNVINKIFE